LTVVSEHTVGYGDESQWSDVDEPSGSQEAQNFAPAVGPPGLRFDEAALAALLMRAVRAQFAQNEDVVSDARHYLPRSDTQMMQVFEEFGLTRSGTEILEPLDEQNVDMVGDSFSGSAIFESSQEEEEEPSSPYVVTESQISEEEEETEDLDDIPYEGYDGGPLEFDTMDEAQEYAARVSREILDEILDELSREHLGESGAVDLTFDQMEQLRVSTVLPGVWELMDDD
jgi:hypothetical protein